MREIPLNQIFFGPPGTGKTYATIQAALNIVDPAFAAAHTLDRTALKRRFDEFVTASEIKFVTFHQSFSYEDFVEGIRAQAGVDGQLTYEISDGIFKDICNSASSRVTQSSPIDVTIDLTGRNIWKMSLGNSLGDDSYIFSECMLKNYALLGWGGSADFSTCKDREAVAKRFSENDDPQPKKSYPVTAVTAFVSKVQKGDIFIVTEGNSKFRAIGEVVGDYRVINREGQGDDYGQCRDVKWLRVYEPSLPFDQLMNNKFSQMTLYQLHPNAIDREKLLALLTSPDTVPSITAKPAFSIGDRFGSGYEVIHASSDIVELTKPNKRRLPMGMSLLNSLAQHVLSGELTLDDIKTKKVFDKLPDILLEPHLVNGYETLLFHLVERLVSQVMPSGTSKAAALAHRPRVLIIDEINRGNVSRIFGELITLIEPSKRKGTVEALEVTLPYSKERFGVPSNIYIIGTMNTADRSLSTLDIALRRRFSFVEMSPNIARLEEIEVQGVNIGNVVRAMNSRIEILLDRDHRLGHAYFLALADDPTVDHLAVIFRDQVLPLLQEYFFDDWTRIQLILNDHRKAKDNCFLVQSSGTASELFGSENSLVGRDTHWTISEDAFSRIESYAQILDVSYTAKNVESERQVTVGDYQVKQLSTGTIEVWRNGEKLPMARPTLIAIAKQIDVDTLYVTGNVANTRELGKRILNALIVQ